MGGGGLGRGLRRRSGRGGHWRTLFPAFHSPGQQHGSRRRTPPAEEPVETGQYMSMDTGWACWESGGPSPREASDLAVWGYLRSHDDMA